MVMLRDIQRAEADLSELLLGLFLLGVLVNRNLLVVILDLPMTKDSKREYITILRRREGKRDCGREDERYQEEERTYGRGSDGVFVE